mmetsp:Transcript_41796/g.68750  ORF Transcript_41796/g.68750 Transcript_41796/m.68750 type:complete len:296 (-) Transcript_41796:252-1139(-)
MQILAGGELLKLEPNMDDEFKDTLNLFGFYSALQDQDQELGVTDKDEKGSWGKNTITPATWRILIDWMARVHFSYGFSDNCLHLAVAILNKYCSEANDVTTRTFQLYGIVSLLLATKYCESEVLEVATCSSLTGSSFSAESVLQAELRMLEVLEFNVTLPTSHIFLHLFWKAVEAPESLWQLACFYSQRALYEVPAIKKHKQSIIALSCIMLAAEHLSVKEYLSNLLGKNQLWSYSEICASEVAKNELSTALVAMPTSTRKKRKLDAINRKFGICDVWETNLSLVCNEASSQSDG